MDENRGKKGANLPFFKEKWPIFWVNLYIFTNFSHLMTLSTQKNVKKTVKTPPKNGIKRAWFTCILPRALTDIIATDVMTLVSTAKSHQVQTQTKPEWHSPVYPIPRKMHQRLCSRPAQVQCALHYSNDTQEIENSDAFSQTTSRETYQKRSCVQAYLSTLQIVLCRPDKSTHTNPP